MAKKPVDAIRVRVLGDARITTHVTTIEPKAEILFAAALYLVLERRESVSRRTLQALLWPDESSRVAAHRLRQTLLKLRQLGVPIQLSGQAHIGLNGAPVSVDYEEFLAARKGVDGGNNDALVMLPAYEPRFSQAYLEWLDRQKAEVNASMTRLMLGIIARHRVKGEWVEVERNASRLLRFQPYNEEATLAMAESCAMRGAKLEAMAILDKYLNEVGSGPTDLRLPATIMRRRIADRMHPRAETIAGQSPLVGRSVEMEQLAGLLESARHKKGKACIVWGDAGIGKSRLLAEFATFASLQGISSVRVQCRSNDPHRPLSVFVDLVPGLRAMRGAIGCSPETFRHIDRLCMHKRTLIETKSESDAEFSYSAIQQSLFDLVDAVSDEGCLILIIEDVHWIDTSSAKLLQEMIAWGRAHSLLFVLSGRDSPEEWSRALPGALTSIYLSALDPEPAKDVLLAVIRQHGQDIDEKYAAWCVTIAEGNPYFLQELGNHWLETGDRHTVPASLTAVLDERISRLRSPTLQMLQACSVLEQHSTLDRIEAVLDYETRELLPAINELGLAGMLVISPDSRLHGPDRFSPRHDLLSNAALAQLSAPALAYLHRRAAAVLEREANDDSSTAILWDSAKHWQLAGDAKHAFELARSCAAHLLEVGLPKAAAEAYEKTMSYCGSPDEKLVTLKGLARAHYSSMSWKEVKKTVAQVHRLRGILSPSTSPHDEFELMAIRARWRHEITELPISQAVECLRTLEAPPDHRVEAGGYALMMCDMLCDHEAMKSIFSMASQVWKTNTVDKLLKLRAEMVYHSVCGDLGVGVSSAQLALEEQRLRGNTSELFTALCNAAAAWRTAGFFQEAEAALAEAVTIADRQNVAASASTALSHLAHMYLELGQWDKARQACGELFKRPVKPEKDSASWRFRGIAVRLALLDGNLGDVGRLLRGRLREVVEDNLPERRVYHLALIVAARLASGGGSEFDEALPLLEQAHLRARVHARQAFATETLYKGLVKIGKKERADQLLHEYFARYRREPWPPAADGPLGNLQPAN